MRIEENIHNEISDDLPGRVFQIAFKGVWAEYPSPMDGGRGGRWEILLGRIFCWVVGFILTFFKAKKQHSINIEYQLKSKLAWLVCIKEYDVERKTGTGWMTTEKNEVLHGL